MAYVESSRSGILVPDMPIFLKPELLRPGAAGGHVSSDLETFSRADEEAAGGAARNSRET